MPIRFITIPGFLVQQNYALSMVASMLWMRTGEGSVEMSINGYRDDATRHGKTLIEMSMVIGIIALLAGMILGGIYVLDNAKTRKQMTQLALIEAGVQSFRAKYNCYPGDCRDPTVIAGYTYAGNGNGYLEPYWNDDESKGFWLHLSLSGMIPDTLYSHPVLSGQRAPKMALNPVGYITAYGSLCFAQNILHLATTDVSGALTYTQVRAIDSKMDDGVASTGAVKSSGYGTGSTTIFSSYPEFPLSPSNNSGSDKCVSSNAYSSSATASCDMTFILSQ